MCVEKQTLESIFDFADPKDEVLLHHNEASICIDGVPYTGDGKIYLDLKSRANIYAKFEGVLPDNVWDSLISDKEKISLFTVNGHKIDGFARNFQDDINIINWYCSEKEPIIGIGDKLTQMTSVMFHLFNFVDLFLPVNLTSTEWKIDIKPLPSTSDNIKKLKNEGGYQLTHIGEIRKVDGAPFFGEDADKYLEALGLFLSFAKGCWCKPMCAVGFDKSDSRVWESWSSPDEPWESLLSWFNPHRGNQLSTLFPSFISRWSDVKWCETLLRVINWYLIANHSSHGIEAGIILIQAGLERLSYEFVVRDKKLLKKKEFKEKIASDQFRFLLSNLNIPLNIPNALPELQNLGNNSSWNWSDALHAFTEIRNNLVHPGKNKPNIPITESSQAWNLGLWYLEMAILAICDYSGTYSNRLKQWNSGQVENAPWK